LVPKSDAALKQMSDQFRELESRALLGPSQAEGVNQRDILKYYYWSAPSLSPEERAYFFEMVQMDFSANPLNAPNESEMKKNVYRRLLGAPLGDNDPLYRQAIADCSKGTGIGSRSPENCDVFARVLMAQLSPDALDNMAVRHKVLERMDAYYSRFFQLKTPLQRLRHHDSLLERTIRAVLFSGNFGPTWSEPDMDAWLRDMETAQGKKLEAGVNSRPLRMADLDGLKGPAEVLASHLPKEIKSLARDVTFSPEAAKHLGLTSPKNSLWDFISQNLNYLYLTSKSSDMPALDLHGQMYSPFLRAIMVDMEDWKNRLGKLYYLGVLAVIAHETYHIYHVRKLVIQNPELQNVAVLDERNAYLVSALVFEQLFAKIDKVPEDAEFQIKAAADFGGYLLHIYSANAALQYPERDETFRTDFSASISKELLRKDPNDLAEKYTKENYARSKNILDTAFPRLNFRPETSSK
jgi:hypothetical protein